MNLPLLYLLLLRSLLPPVSCFFPRAELRDYCWPDGFNASCPRSQSGYSQMMLLEHARYGRMEKVPASSCLKSTLHTGCYADVLRELDKRCSGLASCHVSIPDKLLHKLQPCPKDLFSYMEVAYNCVQVEQTWPCPSKQTILTAPEGVVVSASLQLPAARTSSCSVVILVHPGQRINVTLFDLNVSYNNVGSGVGNEYCDEYATLSEVGSSESTHVCRGTQRQRTILVTAGHELYIELASADPKARFLIHYRAIGCTVPSVPKSATFQRDKDRITVVCKQSSETWYMYCNGTEWAGTTRNCSNEAQAWKKEGSDEFPPAFLSYGLLTAIIIGVVLGIGVGVFLLVSVLVWERRRRRERKSSQPRPALSVCSLHGQARSQETYKLFNASPFECAHAWELRQLNEHDELYAEKGCSHAPADGVLYCAHQVPEHATTSPSAAVGSHQPNPREPRTTRSHHVESLDRQHSDPLSRQPSDRRASYRSLDKTRSRSGELLDERYQERTDI